jgi:hypothetical protein
MGSRPDWLMRYMVGTAVFPCGCLNGSRRLNSRPRRGVRARRPAFPKDGRIEPAPGPGFPPHRPPVRSGPGRVGRAVRLPGRNNVRSAPLDRSALIPAENNETIPISARFPLRPDQILGASYPDSDSARSSREKTKNQVRPRLGPQVRPRLGPRKNKKPSPTPTRPRPRLGPDSAKRSWACRRARGRDTGGCSAGAAALDGSRNERRGGPGAASSDGGRPDGRAGAPAAPAQEPARRRRAVTAIGSPGTGSSSETCSSFGQAVRGLRRPLMPGCRVGLRRAHR